ncbi:sensor histidine kinase [Actinophytocola sp.]|uniref:sensor histidine kinase n=1 Tax=Actinophytocola sp. TaxID=1872138 RepID=UPI002ED3A7A5
MRLSARGRLTVLHTALVLGAGAALVGLTYVLVRRSLAARPVFVSFRHNGEGVPPPLRDPDDMVDAMERLRAETLSQLLTQSALALGIVTLLTALLGWLMASRVLRPIRAMSATAQRLSAENLSERVPVTPPADELAALAQTINGMLERIESGIADRDRLLHGQRMFVANAAHELRTPLTTMRTAIDVTLDGRPSTEELLVMTGDVRDAVVHSQRTIDGLLALARSHTGPTEPRRVDLADLAAGAVAATARRASARGTELRTDLSSARVDGDPVLLDRMIGNLVDNAVNHNEPGGHVLVTTGTEAGHARLRVTNTGQHVDPTTVDSLFEPFVRGPANHPRTNGGTGLGLSIVRAVAEAHHGQVSATAPATGGLDITVDLPLAPGAMKASFIARQPGTP